VLVLVGTRTGAWGHSRSNSLSDWRKLSEVPRHSNYPRFTKYSLQLNTNPQDCIAKESPSRGCRSGARAAAWSSPTQRLTDNCLGKGKAPGADTGAKGGKGLAAALGSGWGSKGT
jgi:hypothetical protein